MKSKFENCIYKVDSSKVFPFAGMENWRMNLLMELEFSMISTDRS